MFFNLAAVHCTLGPLDYESVEIDMKMSPLLRDNTELAKSCSQAPFHPMVQGERRNDAAVTRYTLWYQQTGGGKDF